MASEEQLVFDGLTLNDATFGLAELACPPPRQRAEWIGAADSEAQLLVGDPKHENRDITVKIQVAPQASMDLALAKVAQLVDKCVKASKYQDGIGLTWTAATGTITVTFDVLSAEIVDLPIDWESGWLAFAPTVTIAMKAKPYWRGTRTLTSTTSSSTPVVTAALTNSIGDVPALGELIVTDTATQSRRHVEWGLEGPLTYNASTSLLLTASSDLTVTGFAGTKTTGGSGVYGTAPNQIEAGARTSPTALCGTGNQSHIGTFRVKCRGFWYPNTQLRLSYRVGDGPMTANAWADTPTLSGSWGEVDLGTITIPAVLAGTQRWTGQVDVRTTTGTASAYLNYLVLVPTGSGYGKSRAQYAYTPGVLSGFDDFTGTTAAAALNARVAPAGGTWATSGSATDFAFADDLSGEQIKRSTTSDASARFGILGSSNFTDVEVQATVRRTAYPVASGTLDRGVIARWTDSSNYLRGTVNVAPSSRTLTIVQRVAGTDTTLGTYAIPAGIVANDVDHVLRLVAFASGRTVLYLLSAAGALLASVEASTSVLATAGTLATGKPGIYDVNTSATAITRYYDDISVATPAAEPVVVYSSRNLQVRYDDTIRQDSTGTYTGRPQSYRGSRFLLPVGVSRVLVKARRNDIEAAADDTVTDATQIQVGITPRGLAVPRS